METKARPSTGATSGTGRPFPTSAAAVATAPAAKSARKGPSGSRPEPPRRLVVELSRTSAADLARFVEEEEVNKTTVVNRALAVYSVVRAAQQHGDKVLVRDVDTGEMMQLLVV